MRNVLSWFIGIKQQSFVQFSMCHYQTLSNLVMCHGMKINNDCAESFRWHFKENRRYSNGFSLLLHYDCIKSWNWMSLICLRMNIITSHLSSWVWWSNLVIKSVRTRSVNSTRFTVLSRGLCGSVSHGRIEDILRVKERIEMVLALSLMTVLIGYLFGGFVAIPCCQQTLILIAIMRCLRLSWNDIVSRLNSLEWLPYH